MHHSTTRVATGLCAVVLSACALGAAAPAQANETRPPTADRIVSITATASVYSSPRLNTAVTTDLEPGEQVAAFCGFTNAGLEWVKVFAADGFGYVESANVEGGVGALPRECPSEIETITLPAPGKSFETMWYGAPLSGARCPANYPYLDTRVQFPWFTLVDYYDNRYIPGVWVERPVEIGIELGEALGVDGERAERGDHIGGYGDGTITNFISAKHTASLTVTCTSNVAFARMK